MALKNWIDKKVTKNTLFLFDFVGYEVDRELHSSDLNLNRKEKSYLLDWAFENIAQGFSELITNAPPEIKSKKQITSFFIRYYKDKLYPVYSNRKKAYMFHFGENMSYSDISDIDITSKAFGANDNFANDASPKLDELYSF